MNNVKDTEAEKECVDGHGALIRSETSLLYSENIKLQGSQGHGFAAEKINDLADHLLMRDAQIVGDENMKDGPDRLVNGTYYQTKYYQTPSATVSAAIENKRWRYRNPDGKPMSIEVPSDQYDKAKLLLNERILNGEIEGIPPGYDADSLIKKGHFSYEQAKKVVKFGTLESLAFDSVNGIITSSSTMGISATMAFAKEIWDGKDYKAALSSAIDVSLSVGADTYVNSLLVSQLQKAGADKLFKAGANAITKQLGSELSAKLINSVSGSSLSGAAAKNAASKYIRGTALGIAVGVGWSSRKHFSDLFNDRISGGQFSKKIITSAGEAVGGTAGFMSGASTGASLGSVIPVVGTVIGGVLGGVVGSSLGSGIMRFLVSGAIDGIVDDDSLALRHYIHDAFTEICDEHGLTDNEADLVFKKFTELDQNIVIKDLYKRQKQSERAAINYVYEIMRVKVLQLIQQRAFIQDPISFEPSELPTLNNEQPLSVSDSKDVVEKNYNQPKKIIDFDDIFYPYVEYLSEGKRIVHGMDLIGTKQGEKMGDKTGHYNCQMLFDTTLFKSGSSGFAVLDNGLISYGHAGSDTEVCFQEIKKIELSSANYVDVTINTGEVISMKFIHSEYRSKMKVVVDCVQQYIEQLK